MRALTYGYGSHRKRRRRHSRRRMRRNSKGRFVRTKGSHRRRHHRKHARRRSRRRGRKAMGRKLGAAARKASRICHRRIKAGRLPRRWLKACFRAEMKKAL